MPSHCCNSTLLGKMTAHIDSLEKGSLILAAEISKRYNFSRTSMAARTIAQREDVRWVKTGVFEKL